MVDVVDAIVVDVVDAVDTVDVVDVSDAGQSGRAAGARCGQRESGAAWTASTRSVRGEAESSSATSESTQEARRRSGASVATLSASVWTQRVRTASARQSMQAGSSGSSAGRCAYLSSTSCTVKERKAYSAWLPSSSSAGSRATSVSSSRRNASVSG